MTPYGQNDMMVSLQRCTLFFVLSTATLILLAEFLSIGTKRQVVVKCAESHLEKERGLGEEAGRQYAQYICLYRCELVTALCRS